MEESNSTNMSPEQENQIEEIALAEFLESYPPGSSVYIEKLTHKVMNTMYLQNPEIQLHCINEACNGLRFFANQGSLQLEKYKVNLCFLTYTCKNCGTKSKTYAVLVDPKRDGSAGNITKIGEIPPFGPPIPPRVISLIGPHRELFLKGRQSENQGLGIGAFAYYRRVVENEKNRILDEIIRVSEKLNTPADVIRTLNLAKDESQFSKAIESLKTSIPESLLINGHNPLTLLYKALSKGLHEKSDEECLELATSIRVVLSELAERIGHVLKDEAELKSAINKLMNP